MKWNYRTYKDKHGNFGFIEVYYREDGSISMYSDFIRPHGENLNDLEEDLERMAEALNKPILFENDLPNGEINV